MIAIEVEAPPEREARLVPDAGVTKKGGGRADLESLSGLFSIGTPLVYPFTEELAAKDKELAQFMAHEQDHRFFLVLIACSFRPKRDTPFESASLQIQLQGAAEAQAIAWSMSPELASETVQYERKVNVGSDFKLVKFGAEAGISGERREVCIEATGILQSDPAWEFTRTERVAIRGSHRLFLVVRSPRGIAVTGSLELSMTMRQLHLGLIPYNVELPDTASASFNA